MELILKLAATLTFAANFCLQMVYFTHMLQLNSYRPERYKKWCHDHDDQLVNLPHLLPFLCIPAIWMEGRIGCLWLYGTAALVFLVTALVNIPKKAKKPLVYTPRVIRLLVVQLLLAAVVVTLCWLLTAARFVGFLGLLSVVIWGVTGVAAYITLPLENYIASRFVKDAARILDAHKNLIVIGITGSYGKTSVKTFLHALLSAKYNTLMTPGSYNTTMGVVRTVREMLKPSHQIFLAEMGAKQAGDIKEICDLTHPQYGIISSIGEQHLETFKSLENIIATKFELADALPQNGKIFLNYDNPYIRERKVDVETVTYGAAPDSDAGYRATDIQVDTNGCSFTFITPDGDSRRYETKLLGAHNIQNLAGCMAVAHQLGVSLTEMAYPVRMLKPVPHRLELLPNGYIDDAYNSNPAGFRGALDTLALFDVRRVLVTPGMVELGERQEALNKELGAYAADKCDIAVLVGEKQAPPLKEGLLSAGFPAENIYVAKDLQDGLRFVNNLPPEKQIVLLENDLPDNF